MCCLVSFFFCFSTLNIEFISLGVWATIHTTFYKILEIEKAVCFHYPVMSYPAHVSSNGLLGKGTFREFLLQFHQLYPNKIFVLSFLHCTVKQVNSSNACRCTWSCLSAPKDKTKAGLGKALITKETEWGNVWIKFTHWHPLLTPTRTPNCVALLTHTFKYIHYTHIHT